MQMKLIRDILNLCPLKHKKPSNLCSQNMRAPLEYVKRTQLLLCLSQFGWWFN